MLDNNNIIALRMQRQHLMQLANQEQYNKLYKDVSPVQNIYWCGFGQAPSMTFRTNFDDREYNRGRQQTRELIKGRFQGGNVGFIEAQEMELFAGLYKKPYKPNPIQQTLLELIRREGPMNIAVMKEMTGLLVKEITPALHKLQESFLIFEDQYDGDWERGWYKFEEMFPEVNTNRYTRHEALQLVLKRFAYRYVHFNLKQAHSFYRIPAKEIKAAAQVLVAQQELVEYEEGYMLIEDYALLQNEVYANFKGVLALHRNDFLVKCNEYWLKEKYKGQDMEVLQYLLIDGEFKGAVMGNFKYGPYVIEDIMLDLSDGESDTRKEEILEAVYRVNSRQNSPAKKYNGEGFIMVE